MEDWEGFLLKIRIREYLKDSELDLHHNRKEKPFSRGQ